MPYMSILLPSGDVESEWKRCSLPLGVVKMLSIQESIQDKSKLHGTKASAEFSWQGQYHPLSNKNSHQNNPISLLSFIKKLIWPVFEYTKDKIKLFFNKWPLVLQFLKQRQIIFSWQISAIYACNFIIMTYVWQLQWARGSRRNNHLVMKWTTWF